MQEDFKAITGLMGKLTRAVFEKERDKIIAAHTRAELEARQAAIQLTRFDPEAAKEAESKAAAHLRHLVRLRSTAGHGVHAWTEECPKNESLSLNDLEFNFAVRWRLGLPFVKPGLCKLRSGEDGQLCCKWLEFYEN